MASLVSVEAENQASSEQSIFYLNGDEIDAIAASESPYLKLFVTWTTGKSKNIKSISQVCYLSTEKSCLQYPAERSYGNLAVVMKLARLSKQGGSDQHGYTISTVIVRDTYLQVTDQSVGSKKRAVKFTDPKQVEPPLYHQNQLFKRQKDKKTEARFALYTTVVDSKGHNKIYYLKPDSGSIVAKESSTPDGYYYFSMSQDNYKESFTTTVQVMFENPISMTQPDQSQTKGVVTVEEETETQTDTKELEQQLERTAVSSDIPMPLIYLNDNTFDHYEYHTMEVLCGGEWFQVYTSTDSTQMVFNPLIHSGNWRSNISAVFKWTRPRANRPRQYRAESVVFQDPNRQYSFTITNSMIDVAGRTARPFQLEEGAFLLRETERGNSTRFAYQVINPKLRGTHYLMPVCVSNSVGGRGQLSSSMYIVAVQASSANGFYVFRHSPANGYKPQQRAA